MFTLEFYCSLGIEQMGAEIRKVEEEDEWFAKHLEMFISRKLKRFSTQIFKS